MGRRCGLSCGTFCFDLSVTMIQTRNLSYQYPGSATRLEFPDVDVPQGAVLLLSGPSGCGKSIWLALVYRAGGQPQNMQRMAGGGPGPAQVGPEISRLRHMLGQGFAAALAWLLQLDNTLLMGGMVWPPALAVVPALALGVSVGAALLPAFGAYRVSVLSLLQSR